MSFRAAPAGTKAFKKLVTERDVIEGLPGSALALAAQQAGAAGHKVCHPPFAGQVLKWF